jgi:hypothetical protein
VCSSDLAEKCLLYIGNPTPQIIANFTAFTDTAVTFIPADTAFAKSLGIREGKWAILSGATATYAEIDIAKLPREIPDFLAKRKDRRVLTAEVDRIFQDHIDTVWGWLAKLEPYRLETAGALMGWFVEFITSMDAYTFVILVSVFVTIARRMRR